MSHQNFDTTAASAEEISLKKVIILSMLSELKITI